MSTDDQIKKIKAAINGERSPGQPAIMDRYSAAGIPPPDPLTMCDECEGMGFHPTSCTCGGTKTAHKPESEGWCFVSPCQSCMGTRLRKADS